MPWQLYLLVSFVNSFIQEASPLRSHLIHGTPPNFHAHWSLVQNAEWIQQQQQQQRDEIQIASHTRRQWANAAQWVHWAPKERRCLVRSRRTRCHIVAFCNQLQSFYSPPESLSRFGCCPRNKRRHQACGWDAEDTLWRSVISRFATLISVCILKEYRSGGGIVFVDVNLNSYSLFFLFCAWIEVYLGSLL